MSTLQARKLNLEINGRAILSDIDLDIQAQEFTVLIGPNGSGKSSLLKALAGVEKSSSGTISLENSELGAYSSRQLASKRAVLSQSQHLSFPMQNRDVVRMGILNDMSRKQREDLIRKAMASTGTEQLGERFYHHCSGGEQTLVQMSRILVQLWTGNYPQQVLFLDEPTAALDLKYQLQILSLCKELCKQGLTVFCILHDLQLAAHFADNILVMQGGRIIRRGSPEQILDQQLVKGVYGVQSHAFRHPSNHKPMMVVTP